MRHKRLFLKTFLEQRYFLKFRDRRQLERYQKKRIADHIGYVQKNSVFYKGCSTLEDFTEMDKQKMMENFEQLNTISLSKQAAFDLALSAEESRQFSETYDEYSIGLSSGTSGHRGLFITSPKEQAIWAGTILGKMLPAGKWFPHRIALFLRSNNNLYEAIGNPLIQFRFFDLLEEMSVNLQQLGEFQPTILIGQPSVLLDIAGKKEEGIRPEMVISAAEVLEKEDEHYLKEQFGVEMIHQLYQCTEGFLGCTCRCGNLHLNEDMVYFEKEHIDEQRFIPILTDFRRMTQPFMRYRLNDILVEDPAPCPCGSPFTRIKKIEGRMDDCFAFTSSSGSSLIRIYPDFIRRCLLLVDGIREYQVTQTAKDKVEIAADNTLSTKQREEIRSKFAGLAEQSGFSMPELLFVPYRPPVFPEKMRRIKCLVKEELI